MTYCIYLRKSRKDLEAEQKGEGETLIRHEHALLALASRQNLIIRNIYREIVSGETILDRPVMQQLLQEIEQGLWDGVLVMEIERLARGDTIDQGIVQRTFQYSGTLIITPSKTYDPYDEYDQEYFEFGLFMSRREYQTTKRRMLAGRYAAVKEGKWPFNTTPYGFDRIKLKGEKGWILTPNTKEAPVVKLIFDLFTGTERIGLTKIKEYLNNRGILPRKGSTWIESSLRGILSNAVYDKKVVIGRRRTITKMVAGIPSKTRLRTDDYLVEEGRHPRLITHAVFAEAQEYLGMNSFRLPESYGVKNPLAGLVICSKCGKKMQRRPAGTNLQNKNRQKYDMIICPTSGCPTVATPLDLLEKDVCRILSDWISAFQFKAPVLPNRIHEKQNLLDSAKQQQNVLLHQIGQLHDLLEQGIYSPEIYAQRLAILQKQSHQFDTTIETLNNDLKKELKKVNYIETHPPENLNVFSLYPELTLSEKNRLLKILMKRIIYKKTKKNAYGDKDNPGYDLIIHPRIPRQL